MSCDGSRRKPTSTRRNARSLGRSGRTGAAYVHMAYSAIYANRRKQAKRYVEEARAKARSAADAPLLKRLEAVYKERKEMWEDD